MNRSEMLAKCKKDHPDWTPAQHAAWVEKEMKTSSPAAYSNSIKGVEIFAAGKHNGDDYTEQDLDDMVAAFGVLDYRPALKVGHTKDTPGAPAYGWITNLRKSGTKLLADLTDMHDSVVKAMRDRSYDRFSSEIYFNLKRGGKTFRRALKAVALLGAEVPAVANLTPLHKMEFAAEGDFEKLFTVEGALDVPAQAMYECLAERMSSIIETFNNEEDNDMKTKAQQLKELNEQLAALTGKLTTLTGGTEAERAIQLKTLTAEVSKISDAIKVLSEQTDDGETTAEKAARKAADEATTAALKAANDQITELQADARRRAVAEKVSTLKVPAFRSALEAMYAYAMLHAAEKVKVYSKDKDGKEISADQNLVDIADSFVAGINAQAEKLFKAFASAGMVNRDEGATDPNPGNELDARVKEYLAKNPTVKNYEDAMNAVLAASPELAKAYREGAPTH